MEVFKKKKKERKIEGKRKLEREKNTSFRNRIATNRSLERRFQQIKTKNLHTTVQS